MSYQQPGGYQNYSNQPYGQPPYGPPPTPKRQPGRGLLLAAILGFLAICMVVILIVALLSRGDGAATGTSVTEQPSNTQDQETQPSTTPSTSATDDDGQLSLPEFEIGDCFNFPIDQTSFETVTEVACGEPHTSEVTFIGTFETETYPTTDDFVAVERVCADKLIEYTGSDAAGNLIEVTLVPSLNEWADPSFRRYACSISFSDGPQAGSVKAG